MLLREYRRCSHNKCVFRSFLKKAVSALTELRQSGGIDVLPTSVVGCQRWCKLWRTLPQLVGYWRLHCTCFLTLIQLITSPENSFSVSALIDFVRDESFMDWNLSCHLQFDLKTIPGAHQIIYQTPPCSLLISGYQNEKISFKLFIHISSLLLCGGVNTILDWTLPWGKFWVGVKNLCHCVDFFCLLSPRHLMALSSQTCSGFLSLLEFCPCPGLCGMEKIKYLMSTSTTGSDTVCVYSAGYYGPLSEWPILLCNKQMKSGRSQTFWITKDR